jgi:hypothetical protein
VLLDHKEYKEIQVILALQDLLVQIQVFRAHKGLQALAVKQELLGQLVLNLKFQDLQDLQDL